MCFEPSICSFESSCFQGVKPFFRWTIRQSRQQGKNAEKKKCNEESVACVKAMVDAGARVSLQETAVCIDIDSSSVLGILKKLGFRKVSARWIPHLMMPKTRGLGYNIEKLCLKFTERVIQSALMKDQKVMEHEYAGINLLGSLKARVPKGWHPQIAC